MSEPIPAPPYHAGFVNLIGKPNAGKSTLMNALLGEKLSIVSPKIQTTRHRILGILTQPEYQIVFSDTPGIIPHPKYKLHEAMMGFVYEALDDADVLFYLFDSTEDASTHLPLLERILKMSAPTYLLLNKIDLIDQAKLEELLLKWRDVLAPDRILPVSALAGFGVDKVREAALNHLPEHPAFFPEDEFTDRTERFLAGEVIREKIFDIYRQEIPYASEVVVTSYKEDESILRIAAEIYVERESQKGILIGKGGEALKRVGTQARLDLEKQLGRKVFLELFVKVRPEWRQNTRMLRQFGFDTR